MHNNQQIFHRQSIQIQRGKPAKALLGLAVCYALSSQAFAVETSLPATSFTRAANQTMAQQLDFSDKADFADIERGLIKEVPKLKVIGADGRVVWDMQVYRSFLAGDAPDTVNPSLWRQALLNSKAGLYQVMDDIYQVRGFDLTTMSVIRGEKGWIIIDPLTMSEVAEAAMKLVNQELGERPVTAVIYTHSHPDHFGGVKGVINQTDVDAGKVRVIAPEHFMEHVSSEMSLLGTAMSRRAQYMHGMLLPRNAQQQVDNGLGKGVANGTFTLIEPTEYVTKSIQKLTVDGIGIEFQMTPHTEADAEMMFYFPKFKALMGAENLNAAMHNILTPRGAKVRDALGWSKALDETLHLFGNRSDVVFTSHYWPRWGTETVHNYITKQRDMYKYLHDQTLRLANHGLKMTEIAEQLELPDALGKEWFNRGYYGTVRHNVKGIYQHYIGFWSGNPADLNELPPQEAGQRYVEALGGAETVLKKAQDAFAKGEYRWAAMLLNNLVMASPDNQAAKNLQAQIFEQLGYQTESGPWRNIYLTGAMELRQGVSPKASATTVSPDLVKALSVEHLFDLLAVRLNGPKAAGEKLSINWHFNDLQRDYNLALENSVLNYREGEVSPTSDLSLRLDKSSLTQILLQPATLGEQIKSGRVAVQGDIQVLGQLFALLDSFTPGFNIVTPVAANGAAAR